MRSDLISRLPDHLGERSRQAFQPVDSSADGRFILYWMRTAMRLEENPALDVARCLALELGLPLLIYQGLSQRYPFASDRHHTFILQGARDIQNAAFEKGLRYAFNLEISNQKNDCLTDLANDAAVTVTEDIPVDPPRLFLRSLRRRVSKPILCVDTSCVAPMQLIGKPHTRAFKFRSATKKLYAERLTRQWPSFEGSHEIFDGDAGFQPIDFSQNSIPDLVAQCEIDHSIGPVLDTEGGSIAGNLRWEHFKTKGLSSYARRRNNALMDGVSRMSAYLHYGMVSPLKIAREAAEIDNAGAEKYLDELLIWRELAYNFCFYRSDHDRWSALPDWAQATLETHAADRREDVYSWEQLARAQTHDDLWNAAQTSLLRQGELHNNVRMTWGKAILHWSNSPREALKTIIDLNHRYALDGRDPASYGGILWCLGQFDRPFEPARPVLGTVRQRPTSQHAQRLDVQAYHDRVAQPRFEPVPEVAVIGAGISGLIAARTLADHGLPVTVFEKSRGVGGRMSTRRVDDENHFDHGAQYFTARDPRFCRYVESWKEQGIVQRWPDSVNENVPPIVVLKDGQIQSESRSVDRYVATPGMNSICKHLAKGLSIVTETQIESVESVEDKIRLLETEGEVLGEFDRLVVSVPSQQSAELLSGFPILSTEISKIEMNPCWALMVSFQNAITNDWSGAFVHGSFIAWVARNSTKPERVNRYEQLVVHANHEWTQANWELDAETIAQLILDELWRVTGTKPQTPVQTVAHRWRFAIPSDPAAVGCFFDRDSQIAVCGDWTSGARVEGAFLSGAAAAGRILGTLQPKPMNSRQKQKSLF